MQRAFGHRSFVAAVALAAAAAAAGCQSCERPASTEKADADAVEPADAAVFAPVLPDASPANGTPVPAAAVASAVNPRHLPVYSGPVGSVEGTITVTGDPAPGERLSPASYAQCPAAAAMYGKKFREGTPKAEKGPRSLADAIVAITGYSDFYVPERDEAEEVTIEGCAGYPRRTITVTFGQRLEVKNLTHDFWVPMLDPPQTTVMMMAAPGGDPVKLYPKKPGRYRLVDHDRKYAVADLFVFHHPLHATSRIDGTYRIDGIPVGKVKVNTSHPWIPRSEASSEIEIKAGVVQKVDLRLDNTPPPDAGPPPDAASAYPGLH